MSDNVNENMSQKNVSSGVSKISAEEIARLKSEMNGGAETTLPEKPASSEPVESVQENQEDVAQETSQKSNPAMDFMAGLLAKKRRERALASENNESLNQEQEPSVADAFEADSSKRSEMQNVQDDNQGLKPEESDEAEEDEVPAGINLADISGEPEDVQKEEEQLSKPQKSEIAEVLPEKQSSEHVTNLEYKHDVAVSEKEKAEAQKGIPSAKNLTSVADDLVVTEDDGTYTSNLDFTKNKSIMKTKLPLPKLPFIIAGVLAFVAVLVVGIFYVIEITRPPEPVVLTSAVLNVQSIDAGYVGENLDLRGVKIECKYSDGTEKTIYDVENYISEKSNHFHTNGMIVSSGNNGYVKFVCEGKELVLVTKTYAYQINDIAEVRMEKSSYSTQEEIKFADIIVFVEYAGLGNKVLTTQEVELRVTATLDDVILESSGTGFVIPSGTLAGTGKELIFEYNGHEYKAIIEIVDN